MHTAIDTKRSTITEEEVTVIFRSADMTIPRFSVSRKRQCPIGGFDSRAFVELFSS